MKIPLTLAIILALIITTAGDRYAVPQVNLLELVRLEGDQVQTAVERVNGAPVYRLRGRLLPLMYLRKELSMSSQTQHLVTGADPGETQNVNIIVFGLTIDSLDWWSTKSATRKKLS